MKNKLTKAALALGTIATIAAPVAAVVSCGTASDNLKSVVIKYTWASNGAQIKALQPIVNYYNEHVKAATDYPVKLVHIEGGYGDAMKLDTKDMKMGNMSPVADAIIDYPDSLGSLTSKALNFKTSETDTDLEDLFEGGEKATYLTTEVEGAKSGVYSLPLAKSTEMLSIDIPFMAALKKAGIVTFPDASKIAEKVKAYETGNDAEIQWIIDNKIGAVTPNTTTEITDDTINDYDLLMDAGDVIAKASGKISTKAMIHVVGEDSPTNLLYQLFNARAGYDMSKFLFHEKSDKTFDYTALENVKSEGGVIVNEILTTLTNHVNSGALVINGAGAYSSSDFVDHSLPFVIGSTAGFSHNFKAQGAYGIKPATGAAVELAGYSKEIVKPTGDLASKGALAMTDDKYHNPIWPSDHKEALGAHDYKVKDAATDAKIKAVLAGEAMMLKEEAKNTDSDLVSQGDHLYSFVSGKKVPMSSVKDNEHVNAEEVLSLGAPQKSNVPTNVAQRTQILSQGPSFIGIRHNNQRDAETIKFMEWFFNPKSTVVDANGETSPVDMFDNASGYITPVKGAFDKANSAKYKDGNLVSFNAFAAVSNDPNGIAFDNPVSRLSSGIRDSAEAGLKTIYTNGHSDKTGPLTALYGDFKKSFSLK